MTLALYVRISRDSLGLRAGVERQLADCHKIAAERWPGIAVAIHEDNDTSAYHGKRPAFDSMCRAIATGHIKVVVAYNLDRLFRQPRDLEAFIDLCAKHGAIAITAEGDLALDTDDGKFKARILAAVATKESDDKSRRITRAKLDAASKGKWLGGPAPYGYTLAAGRLTVNPDQATVVVDVARRVLDGQSLRSLAAASPTGAPGNAQAWRRLLLSPTVRGRTRHGAGHWEPIIDASLGADLTILLTTPDRLTHHGTEKKHWPSGLLECATCNRWLRRRVHHGRGQFICSCGAVSIDQQRIEDYLYGAIMAAAPTIQNATTPDPVAPDPALEQRLAELSAAYATGQISNIEWSSARSAVSEMMAAAAATNPQPRAASEKITAEAWKMWTPMQRHREAKTLLRRVVIWPSGSGRWSATGDRVTFDWIR